MSTADAYQAGEDFYAECACCGYRERNFESLDEAQAAADRHRCEIRIETGGMACAAVMARTGRLLALEWPPAGLAQNWRVGNELFNTAPEARAALIRAAIVALNELPPCGMTHDEHMAAWRSWRDDCIDPVIGCGFAVQDVDQCDRGHPDDGVTYCGACGHESP